MAIMFWGQFFNFFSSVGRLVGWYFTIISFLSIFSRYHRHTEKNIAIPFTHSLKSAPAWLINEIVYFMEFSIIEPVFSLSLSLSLSPFSEKGGTVCEFPFTIFLI